jgi:secreted trypsin-like serine protease
MHLAHPTEASFFDTFRKAVAIVQNINNQKSVICSGTPLAQNIILTAAHCLPDPRLRHSLNPEFNLSVLTLNRPREEFKIVRRWIRHPDFQQQPKRGQEDFDLAIIQTENALTPEEREQIKSIQNVSARPLKNSQLWISGFSPTRIGLSNPLEIIRSPATWSDIRVLTHMPAEGKFLAVSRSQTKVGACAGDSGAPVWAFKGGQAALSGLVVQANCEKGQVKIVDIEKYSGWIAQTARHLSEEPTTQ